MYKPVIGFEVHLQPKTKSKMFCSCSAQYFGDEPNTNVCPVCMGLPGAMPVPNKEALEKCVLLAMALNCEIAPQTKFDRKNYFYPDLPKGYQISQYDQPIGANGYIEFDIEGDSRRIRIKRVHIEEDTAKSVHMRGETMIDFNKSSVPLIEIVTEPDFESIDEVDKFAKRLRQIIRYLNISDADMEKGQMRYELNISVKRPGQTELPNYRVEVKNIASISVLKKIIESETKRQTEALEKNEKLVQETRGLRGMSGETASQRTKEEADDYRYFPEPDIPPIEFESDHLESIKHKLIELPQEKKLRYLSEYKLEPDTAETLVSLKSRAMYFENAIAKIDESRADKGLIVKEIAKWMIGELAMLMKKNKDSYAKTEFKSEWLFEIIDSLFAKKINGTIAKEVLAKSYDQKESPLEIIKSENLEISNDSGELEKVVDKVIAANPKVVEDIQKNPNAAKFLLGQVMREMKGRADAKVVDEILSKKLA